MDVLILVSHSALIFLSHHITSHVSLLVLVLFMFVFFLSSHMSSYTLLVIFFAIDLDTVVPYHHFFSSACVACRLFFSFFFECFSLS